MVLQGKLCYKISFDQVKDEKEEATEKQEPQNASKMHTNKTQAIKQNPQKNLSWLIIIIIIHFYVLIWLCCCPYENPIHFQ